MEQLKTISVVPHKERHDDAKPASPSWFVAKINPVSRFIGALILCIPMFVTLDVVSASVALALEVLLLWIGGVAPWTVLRKTWPVWIAASGSFISVSLYGKTSGAVLVNLGDVVVISQGSLYLALATFLRVAAIAVPGVILALGLDPTDLADGLVQILHLPSRFVYGGLAGMRMFTLLQDDWRALAVPSFSWIGRRQRRQTCVLAGVQSAGRVDSTRHETRHRHGSSWFRRGRSAKRG